MEQCNYSCLLALHHLYVDWCLQTRCVCLLFLNGFPPLFSSQLEYTELSHSKERERGKKEICHCGRGGGGSGEMKDIEGEGNEEIRTGGAEKILMGALEDLL